MKDLKGLGIYALKSIILMVITFIIILTICFVLIRMLPLDPGQVAPGTDPEIFYRIQVSLGRMVEVNGEYVQTPIIDQYIRFWTDLFAPQIDPLTGQELSRFGYSWSVNSAGISPWDVMVPRFPPTILINVYSMVFSVPIGLLLGIYMALKKNKWQDHALSILVMVVISVPSFIYALLLQVIDYAAGTPLPAIVAGIDAPWVSSEMFVAMILPVLAMSFGSIAGYSRYTRAELTEVLTSDFMLLARTKGLTRFQATVRHAFRNSLVPIFPMILGEFISVLSGSIVIEQVFSIEGVGKVFLQSVTQKDYDLFLFVGMFYTIIGLVGGLIVDLSYGIVDPRIRMGGGKQ